jgi:hypothetical protein
VRKGSFRLSGMSRGGGAEGDVPPLARQATKNAQLRMDLLAHEWSKSAERMHTQISELRESVLAIPRGNLSATGSAERESLLTELDAIPAQLEALSRFISPQGGADANGGAADGGGGIGACATSGAQETQPTPEDTSHGWEQYRSLSLKVSRLAARVDECANDAVAASGMSMRKKQTKAKGGGATSVAAIAS